MEIFLKILVLIFSQKLANMSKLDAGVVRGIDFKNVDTVVNFDVPESATDYTHRVGRTARGQSSGTAITLANETESELMKSIEELRKGEIFCDFFSNFLEIDLHFLALCEENFV